MPFWQPAPSRGGTFWPRSSLTVAVGVDEIDAPRSRRQLLRLAGHALARQIGAIFIRVERWTPAAVPPNQANNTNRDLGPNWVTFLLSAAATGGATAGASIFIPRGTPHTIENMGPGVGACWLS